jgi:glycosyltransferase involved in cell wall biosynthesis
MKVLFLTITRFETVSERGIYTDLMREFRDNGHDIYIASPNERRYRKKTSCKSMDGVTILNIWTLNVQKTNLIEKGLCTLIIDSQFKKAIRKHYHEIKFDLVLYSTPPITFTNTIQYIKKKDNAVSYLLLKDIFPQNAVDMEMISNKGIIYSYFRKKEKLLYSISDYIGCLSPANVNFLIKHNPDINPKVVEVNPNSIKPIEEKKLNQSKINIRNKYNIPSDAIVFIYGGNLGKPQGIDFLLKVLSSNINDDKVFIVIVGSGTEFSRLLNWQKKLSPKNIKVINSLPKNDYDELLLGCDIGLIFLDNRFTIPNIPSRLLPYIENKMPVLAATDINTDIGKIITDNEFGFWVESGDLKGFNKKIEYFIKNPKIIDNKGKNAFNFLINNYTVDITYKKIIEKIHQ